MIQRIQTVYLLLVVVLGTLLCFFTPVEFASQEGAALFRELDLSFAHVLDTTDPAEPFAVMGILPLTILTLCMPVISLIVIFLYRNRVLQARLIIINLVLCLGWYAMLAFYVWYVVGKYDVEWYPTMWAVLPMVNVVLSLMALRGVVHDEALVRAADRIR